MSEIVPSSIQVIQDQNVTEGNNLTLTCNASGIPSPMVSWIKPDGQSENGSVLKLVNIRRNQTGAYRCEAIPSSIIQITQHQNVTEGDNVTLMCDVSGVPPPMVSWITPNGQRVSRNPLKVENVSRSEAGEYKCEASNECGNATEMTSIDVQYKPENVQLTTSAIDNKACKGAMISFNCSADARPSVTSYQLFENDAAILVVKPLGVWKRNVSTSGVFAYKCVANNSLGSGVSSYVMVTVNDSEHGKGGVRKWVFKDIVSVSALPLSLSDEL
ncbi:peroxidasin homolog, partial [Stylophora pistillata]|uniref:peroxidasin homolog n=1 Tax=Stylophora pistillata TaxID=50429 RepID=UPI000C041C75